MADNEYSNDELKRLYPAHIAPMLEQNSGVWTRIRQDKHNRIYALISKYRNDPPAPYRTGHFEFKAISAGYGTGESILAARHVRTTFPLSDEVRADIRDGLI